MKDEFEFHLCVIIKMRAKQIDSSSRLKGQKSLHDDDDDDDGVGVGC